MKGCAFFAFKILFSLLNFYINIWFAPSQNLTKTSVL